VAANLVDFYQRKLSGNFFKNGRDFTILIRGDVMRNRAIFLAILLPQLLACTSTQEIVVDDRKVNSREYDRDLEDCSWLAG